MWVAALYLWGSLNLLGGGKQVGLGLPNCTVIPAGSGSCLVPFLQGLGEHGLSVVLFTVPMLCLGALMWISVSGTQGRRFF